MISDQSNKSKAVKACAWLMLFAVINDLKTVQSVGGDKILSRKRRYLTFPKGSAIQLVYDTYYPILENNNVGVIGITAAMAWELPSQPLHVNEVLQGAYEEGDLPLLNRNDELDSNNIDDTTTGQLPFIPNTYNYYNTNKTERYYNNKYSTNPRQDNYYYSNMKATENGDIGISQRPIQPNNPYYSNYKAPNPYNAQMTNQNGNGGIQRPMSTAIDQFSNKMDYYFSYADKILNNIYDMGTKKYEPWQQARWGQKEERNRAPYRQNYYPPNQGRHFIHPIFKRHAPNESISQLDSHHLQLHRTSRHTFYEKISRFMDMRKIDGVDCVLKALCETGQKRKDNKPAPFLVEIFRAIFSLPPVKHSEGNHKTKLYEDAHLTTENCDKKFYKCEGSIWSPDFTFSFNKMQM